jgi:ketosteroid isomerase-like protein
VAQESTLESRIREKLQHFSALLRARDPAAADELGKGGAPLFGSEAHEQYFTRDEIASHLDEIYAKPFLLSFDWKKVLPSRSGAVVWAVVDADLVIDEPGKGRRAMPYRLTAIFEEVDGELLWRLFSGSEPALPPPVAAAA